MKIERIEAGLYRADFRDTESRRVRVNIKADSKREAEAEARRMAKGQVQAGSTAGSRLLTLSQAFTRADREHFVHGKNRRHTSIIMRQLECKFGPTTLLRDVDRPAIMLVVEAWSKEGLAHGTINRKLSVLGRVFKLALDWTDSGVKEVPRMPKMKESKGRTRVLTQVEQVTIAKLLSNSQLHQDLFHVLLDTGMRLGEALGLQHTPVDDNIVASRILKELHAVSECNLQKRKIHIWVNKGNRPRTIPMTDRVFAILEQRTAQLIFGELTGDSVSKQWKRIQTELGDKDLSAHVCRHTCATRLWELTGDIYLVKEWLGHASVTTTERYTHLSSSRLDSAVGLLNQVSTYSVDMDTSDV